MIQADTGQSPLPGTTGAGARWLARLSFAAAAAAVVLVLAAAGLRGSLGLILFGAAGSAAGLAAAWGCLTHRGVVRWLLGAVVVLAPAAVLVLFARADLLWAVIACGLLWAGAIAAGRRALTLSAPAQAPAEHDTPPPRRPFLIMNPRSGGGKVERFALVDRARALGAEVYVLDGPDVDVEQLARQALRNGADLLGVAGGDGTQALVAGIAAAGDVPFMVISAGTRNHFALDLGLDRENPATCLDALTDGVEMRVDLGRIGDRTFVNNASFGAYASVVRSPAYRDDKIRTTLDLLPDVLQGRQGPRLRLSADGASVSGPQAVLVSNNPYEAEDIAGLGRRPRLNRGVLGVLTVTVRGAADAAGMVRGRRRSAVLSLHTTTEAVVEADTATIPVGVDGEAVLLPTPVRCVIEPSALRVRVPRRRPGVRPPLPEMDWARLRHLALARH
jgi:diacylglycerol kinase family enzyme